MPTKRAVHDVTTAYVAEIATGVLRARNQSVPEISIGCGQITPEYLRDRNPVKREKIPDKRQYLTTIAGHHRPLTAARPACAWLRCRLRCSVASWPGWYGRRVPARPGGFPRPATLCARRG